MSTSNVKAGHDKIGSSRNRMNRAEKAKVEVAKKTAKIATATNSIFSKLEEPESEPVEESEAEAEPRLADFRDLVFLGKMEEEVEIAGWKFSLKTLTGQEQRELLARIMSLDADKRLIYAKPYTIEMALSKINSTPVEVASTAAGFEDSMSFICSWQDPLIEKLYLEYEKLFNKSKNVFSPGSMESDLKK